MQQPICRVNDLITGTCTANATGHPRTFTGHWVSGSTVVTADGIGVIRVGDPGITDCGHHIVATVGSTILKADGIGVVRVGDAVIVTEGGTGVTTTGSPVVGSL